MLRKVLVSKLHRARVTDRDTSYEGSITIDESLMRQAQLRPYVDVEIYNVHNGARFNTYVIPGGTGEIVVNGAAARLVERNDPIIICHYGYLTDEELGIHKPTIILLNENNEIIRKPQSI